MSFVQRKLVTAAVAVVVVFSFCNVILLARECPEKYIKNAIEVFKHRKGKVIVEIGTMRKPLSHPIGQGQCSACIEGHSTMWWATTGAEVYSVDISEKNIALTHKICKNFNNVHAIAQDGISFLKSFKQPIDLLFLDAWDASEKTPYAEKHLEAYLAARPNMHNKSLILIDDTDLKDCGKGKLVIPQAIKDGYKVIFSGRQTLLAKENK